MPKPFLQSRKRRVMALSGAAVGLLAAAAASVTMAVPYEQVVALKEFFMATNGSRWRDASGWGDEYPCSWFGLSCADGRTVYVSHTLYRTARGDIVRLRACVCARSVFGLRVPRATHPITQRATHSLTRTHVQPLTPLRLLLPLLLQLV